MLQSLPVKVKTNLKERVKFIALSEKIKSLREKI
jgi:hypothetical protein